jgi:NHL repeat
MVGREASASQLSAAANWAPDTYQPRIDGMSFRELTLAVGIACVLAGACESAGGDDGGGAPTPAADAGTAASGTASASRRRPSGFTSLSLLAGRLGERGDADGDAATAAFNFPQSLATDGNGNLYVNDNTGVRAIVLAAGKVTTLSRLSEARAAGDSGHLFTARIEETIRNDMSPHWRLDIELEIEKLAIATGRAKPLVGSRRIRPPPPKSWGKAQEQICATVVIGGDPEFEMNRASLAYDEAGNLFVALPVVGIIRKFVIRTGKATTLAGSPWEGGSADGVGTAAKLDYPSAMAYDGAGALYVADTGNATIREVEVRTGSVTTVAGSPGIPGNADGIGGAAKFNGPSALAYDGAGNLYVADTGNSRIARITVATREVTTIVDNPDGAEVRLGPLATARLGRPTGLAVGPGPALYVSLGYENAVLELR